MYLSAANFRNGEKTHVCNHEGGYTFSLCKGTKSIFVRPQRFFYSVDELINNKDEITCKHCLRIIHGEKFKTESENWHIE